MSAPQLAIVVDTEEEFDWSRPFARENTGTSSIPAQTHAQAIYARFGAVPTYVVDYPVATDPVAVGYLSALLARGEAEIGAHLHPWVTPPHEEEVTQHNSYHCNLPAALERAKIEALTDSIERGFGVRPTVFKAGRYGFGARTAEALAALGYTIDCSYVPHVSFASDGGPNFRGTPDQPFWLSQGLLEVPLTSGFFGAAAAAGPPLAPLFDSERAARLRLPGILARTGLVARSRLTPEGVPAEEQCRLLRALVDRGRRFFTLTYHSPSLEPGHTPYVRTEADLALFLSRIEHVLRFFRDELGGEFTTLTRHRAQLLNGSAREAA
jgi:hypothetical protein